MVEYLLYDYKGSSTLYTYRRQLVRVRVQIKSLCMSRKVQCLTSFYLSPRPILSSETLQYVTDTLHTCRRLHESAQHLANVDECGRV